MALPADTGEEMKTKKTFISNERLQALQTKYLDCFNVFDGQRTSIWTAGKLI